MIDESISVQEGDLPIEKDRDHLVKSLKHEIEMLQAKIEAIYEEMEKLDQVKEVMQNHNIRHLIATKH